MWLIVGAVSHRKCGFLPMHIAAACMVAIVATVGIRIAFFRCPRCGNRFVFRGIGLWGRTDPFTKKCRTCGLSAESTSEAPASLGEGRNEDVGAIFSTVGRGIAGLLVLETAIGAVVSNASGLEAWVVLAARTSFVLSPCGAFLGLLLWWGGRGMSRRERSAWIILSATGALGLLWGIAAALASRSILIAFFLAYGLSPITADRFGSIGAVTMVVAMLVAVSALFHFLWRNPMPEQ